MSVSRDDFEAVQKAIFDLEVKLDPHFRRRLYALRVDLGYIAHDYLKATPQASEEKRR